EFVVVAPLLADPPFHQPYDLGEVIFLLGLPLADKRKMQRYARQHRLPAAECEKVSAVVSVALVLDGHNVNAKPAHGILDAYGVAVYGNLIRLHLPIRLT